MRTRIQATLARSSLLTALLLSSVVVLPALIGPITPPMSREEKCEKANIAMQLFFGTGLDRDTCLKYLKD